MGAPLPWPPAAQRWPHADASARVTAGGIGWHVQTWDGPPDAMLLLVHGSGGSTHSWADLAPRLAARGFGVVAPDLPGHAFTERPPDEDLTLAGIARLLRALLGRLELEPVAIVGHSAGAAVALELAHERAGVRGVVGLCPSLLSGRDLPAGVLPDLVGRSVRSRFAARLAAGLVRHTDSLGAVLSSTGSEVPAGSARLYRRLTAAPDHVNAVLTLFSQWRPQEVEALLPLRDTPCLLVAGGEDRWIPEADVRRAAGLLPRGRALTLEGLGHLAHEEAAARVEASIVPFLEGVVGRPLTPPTPGPGGPPPGRRA